MKIALIGGHVTPALAVIDALPQDAQVLFIGRKYAIEGDAAPSLEYTAIRNKGIQFISLTTGRIQRKLTRYTVLSYAKIPYGFIQSVAILLKYRPDVVIGFGGYLSVPVGLAASFLGIPLVIHEQTLEAGLANKILARFANKVCISWRQSEKFFPKSKTVLTGNPLRKFHNVAGDIEVLHKEKHLPLLYITGGGTGSHAINLLVGGCLVNLLEKFRIIHQTGDSHEFRDFEMLETLKRTLSEKLQKRYYLTKFIKPYDVGAIMNEADLVVSRSGMNTTTELLFFGKPCLLIPLPTGQQNEQLNNAQFIKKTGIGTYVLQKDLTANTFLTHIEDMVERRAKFQVFAKEAKSLIYLDATDRIIKIIYEAVSQKR